MDGAWDQQVSRRRPERGVRARLHRLLCPLLASQLLIAAAGASAVAQDRRPALAERAEFDIPSQPLVAALETYSVVTGRQVVYSGSLAEGRRSMAVRGRLTSGQALEGLLQGTGLSPRYVAADAFMLDPSPLGEGTSINTAPPSTVEQYYGRLQAGLKRAFCADRLLQPGGYRVAVSFWIGAAGGISRVDLLGSTGDAARDDAIGQAIYGLSAGAPPPAGFAQPVVLVIERQAIERDCIGSRPGAVAR
ncbi:TonB C-terminal domain-containing protein [Bradyrhizobium sp. U87765 SZCCT0131]|uniref:secretin and TonB N-terminal domain-containing protein n=1 Tax=unclassified Bradyrhizobium TaxID=2631580 RepID=UPI001BA58D74|nr:MULTISPECIES: secretin and TonB N-terminal domain-containing protein [unclassified Bradyrhizobium]MBR1220564.1 TonB C-terminal domain-containing protein [Bradyrhizobium sp. U87765 SZCCT0131]MBR1262982.1 TonB C-terminal domain-containing protein [Bradyrhizobium sp. U87765 SZCCT0134]MBR1307136.1 TonB C-terminal domain-containing protein [Bradyrhizobium sp. U87765 SZCCT0110]MBR1322977.1 TonB C-terminal domain-containing protein [Bradyrhizobium sp. U87765 SZCCT0109]MBR1346090.1 TonB C-terminal 